ncbi:S8 family peptidase [Bacillus sp. FJAT-44742]|uniref:S8 family peptidase n=1 Tax=Bacillus sp. FJAT-44742 TaxID=2014005 RepID=UPI0012FEBE32|nr:S8 family peptidase [Bacillus sp. FJAT-44742]
MRVIVSILLIVLLITVSVFNSNAYGSGQEKKERYLVTFENQGAKDRVHIPQHDVVHDFSSFSVSVVEMNENAANGLANNPHVTAVEKDSLVHAHSQSQKADWGLTRIYGENDWETGFTGEGVKIALLDSGIAEHPDLEIAGGAAFLGGSRTKSKDYTDENGHGTHVAGIVGALNNEIGTVGIAHEAEIYGVKVLDKNGSGFLSDVAAGVDWAVEHEMDIINLSLGTSSHSTALEKAVNEAYEAGVLVVASAGNSGNRGGNNDTVMYPAKYESVIGVGATNQNDERPSFSSTGPDLEAAAPGVQILSTYMEGDYTNLSGTSMAAPYVAGNLALLKNAYPDADHKEIRERLQNNYTIDLGSTNRYGYGLIQAPHKNKKVDIEDDEQADENILPSMNVTVSHESPANGKLDVTISTTNQNDEEAQVQDAEIDLFINAPRGKDQQIEGFTDDEGTYTGTIDLHRNFYGEYLISGQVTHPEFNDNKDVSYSFTLAR